MSAPSQNCYKKGEADNRPWGRWEVIDAGESFVVKRITVNSGQKLSLQLHHHRSEHWIVVNGVARVTNGEIVSDIKAGNNVFIPVETKHRVENTHQETLVFIEIQTGEILDENDIVRFEDNYGRVS